MRKIILFCIAFLFSILPLTVFSQYIKINNDTFQNLKIKYYQYFDEFSKKFSDDFPLGCRNFLIKINNIEIDTIRKKLFISGRSCISLSPEYPQCGVNVFKAVRVKDTLLNITQLTRTKCLEHQTTNSNDDGYFDLVFDYMNGENLYFYIPLYYIIEYDIKELFH
ncbi:MAG: hypothetical protein QM541_01445 [Flavobacterium sp.]|nr:hypothetical protein [Flavobacterium sp.]